MPLMPGLIDSGALENLDHWSDLDGLAWSLDSDVWEGPALRVRLSGLCPSRAEARLRVAAGLRALPGGFSRSPNSSVFKPGPGFGTRAVSVSAARAVLKPAIPKSIRSFSPARAALKPSLGRGLHPPSRSASSNPASAKATPGLGIFPPLALISRGRGQCRGAAKGHRWRGLAKAFGAGWATRPQGPGAGEWRAAAPKPAGPWRGRQF